MDFQALARLHPFRAEAQHWVAMNRFCLSSASAELLLVALGWGQRPGLGNGEKKRVEWMNTSVEAMIMFAVNNLLLEQMFCIKHFSLAVSESS